MEQLQFLLKWCYVGYYFFGEEKFNKAFKKIKDILPDEVDTVYLFNKLFNNLNFIQDFHFWFGHNRTGGLVAIKNFATYTFYLPNYLFEIKNNVFYIKINEKLHEILSINDEKNFQKYIKNSCDINGNFYLGLTLRKSKNFDGKITIKLKNGEQLTLQTVMKDKIKRTKEVLSFKIQDDILWIKNKSCECYKKEDINFFQNNLLEIKNIKSKIVVINATANGGGTDSVVRDIMQCLGIEKQNLYGYQDICFSRCKNNASSKEQFIKNIMQNYEVSSKNNTPYVTKAVEPQIYGDRHLDRIICIMQDTNSHSAGETYNAYANYNNLILLGDYTHGGQHFGNICPILNLNNSGIQTVFGGTFFHNAGDKFIETVGYEPDIFLACDAKDNQTAVKNFIEKNL